jgi:formylglycine-generating enzyme required for sulfatase activity
MKGILRVAVLMTMLAAPAAILIWWLTQDDPLEESRYQLRETELVVSSLYGSSPMLYKAGRYLQDTLSISVFDGRSTWLQPGNYFLSTDDARGQYLFPVPLTGYRCGPDKDDSFIATLRPPPKEYPPNSLGDLPQFMFIPSGNFLLGDRLNPGEQHYVWLTGYFISPFEVSNEEFREFMKAPDGYTNDDNWTREGRVWKYSARSRATALLKTGDLKYKRFGRPDQPVAWVNWFEANAFCKWLNGKLGNHRWLYSLPTDAEWEKAARGPDNLDYSLSMTISDNETSLYNWKKNPDSPVTVVGIHDSQRLYRPNRYGLYHMSGNVVEWTQSTDRPYNRLHPYAEDERNHDDTPGARTARGGSWYSASIAYLYIPYRDAFQPEHSSQDAGFRVVVRPLP